MFMRARPAVARSLSCPSGVTCDEVEARVLSAPQEKLLQQDLFEEFCNEFTREMNRLRMERRASLSKMPRRRATDDAVRAKKMHRSAI
jgi:hypothetical protein